MTKKLTFEVLAIIKEKTTRKVRNDDDDAQKQVEDVLSTTEQNTWNTSLPLKARERSLSVEELLSDFVELRLWFCLKFIAAGAVFLVLPLVFDYVLFAQKVDYAAWQCVDTAAGLCSEVTNGGSLYTRDTFCSLNPIDSLPSQFYSPDLSFGVSQEIESHSRANLSKFFVRDVNFTWPADVNSYFAVRLSLYCDSESSNHMDMIYIGVLIGGVFSGLLIDRLGRKPPLIISSILGYLLVLVLIFVRDYTGLVIIQALHGIVYSMYAISSFIWLSENIPRRYRPLSLILYCSMITFGRFLFAILVTEIANWKDITICIMFICMISSCTIHFLPESIQFLLSHHLDSEARNALFKLSTKWQTYSKVLTLKTQSEKSHRDEDNFGALFTHKKVGYRVLIILYLWGVTTLPLTNRAPSDTLSLPIYYVIRSSVCWVVELAVISLMIVVGYEKLLLSALLFFTAMFTMLSLLFHEVVLNLVVQVLSEASYLILIYLTVEVVPMPQRASVFGLGYSFLGVAALINLHYFSLEGGDLVLRAVISCLLTLGSLLALLLPVFQNKVHPVSFTIGEAKKSTGKRTLVICEKEVFSSTPPSSGLDNNEARKSSTETVLPDESNSDDIPHTNMKYIVYNKADHVDRYIFLDKGNRRLDIQFERTTRMEKFSTKSGKEPTEKRKSGSNSVSSSDECDSVVIVNVYRDDKLEKSFHQKSPSLVIDYDSVTSDINDVYVVEEAALSEMIANDENSPVYTVPIKKRNPQSSASYMEIDPHHKGVGSCDATVGSNSSVLELALGEDFESDGTFEVVTPTSLQALTSSAISTQAVMKGGSDEQTLDFSDCEEEDINPVTGTLRKFNTHMQLERVIVSSDMASKSGEEGEEKWRNVMGEVERMCNGEQNLEYIRYETPVLPSPESVQSRDQDGLIRFTEWEFNVFDESPIHWFPLSSGQNQVQLFGSISSTEYME